MTIRHDGGRERSIYNRQKILVYHEDINVVLSSINHVLSRVIKISHN